ncbi:MAG: CDP-glycerol glycerophosphotransferase family protein [Anaerovoracaceae bacterium]|jgi:CDP-ribitol ribitolphosphotransferase
MITNIFWRRTYLFIEYQSPETRDIIIENMESGRKHQLHSKKITDGTCRAKINLTIAEGRRMLGEGSWIIKDGETGQPLPAGDEVLFRIEDFSRVFRYSKDRFAYVVSFHIEDAADMHPYIRMYTSYMRHNRKPQVQEGKLRPVKAVLNAYYQVISHLIPKRGKNIMFMSENMEHIRDNLKAIDTRIKERGLDREFKITYNFRNIFGHPQDPVSWLKTINKIAKQDFIFVDDYVPIFGFLNLHPGTKLIQAWHAGFGFKLVGYGRFGIAGSPHPFVSCHRKYDYALIGNDHLREIYSEVFGIEPGALLATGMPRLEHFLDSDHMEECRQAFYREYPRMKGRRIIIFAPTYRGIDQASAYYDYDQLDMKRLYDYCCRSNSAVIFKMHHFIRDPFPIRDEYMDRFLDLSDKNLNDLFYVSDLLITDYSSCFYDYLLLGRPVLFFVYDKARYSATRGVHRPIDKVAPRRVCNDFDELMEALETGDYGEKEAAEMLTDKCRTNEVTASDKVIDYILLGKEVPDICEK